MSIIGPIVSSLGGRESVCTSLLTDGWAIFVGILNASVLSWRVLLALMAGASSCFEGFTGSVVFIVLAATSPAAFLILKEGFVLPLLWASRFMEDGSGDGKCCYQHHPMGRGLFAASLCYLCPGWAILVLLLAGLFVFVFGFPVALGMVAMSGFLIGLALCFFLVKQGLLCGKSRFLQYICAVMEDSDDGKNAGSTWFLIMFVALIMLGARFAALFCLNMTNRGMDYGAALGTAYSEFLEGPATDEGGRRERQQTRRQQNGTAPDPTRPTHSYAPHGSSFRPCVGLTTLTSPRSMYVCIGTCAGARPKR